MADAHEAWGKHMEQEAAQELLHRQGHQALLVAVGGVSPAEGNLAVLLADQTVIGDGHPVGVAAEITENMLRATKGWFAVNHPVVAKQGAEERGESLGIGQKLEVPVEAELAVGEGLLQSINELAAEDSTQHLPGEKEARGGVDPALVIGGEAAGRHHTMEMGMVPPARRIP